MRLIYSSIRLLILLCFLLYSFMLSAQLTVNGRVTDISTHEPLAFVAVVEQGTVNGTYSDIDGKFSLSITDSASVILFNYVGYLQSTLVWDGSPDWQVSLKKDEITLGEVTIRPGVNPAERIINAAIANKKRNNPEGDIAFTYDSYNKLVFTGKLDTIVMNDPSKYAGLDTNSREAYDFFNSQYLFMMESVSQRKFMPPNHSEETIIANRVSGLKLADFALLGTQMQSFSFYGESVNILDLSYLSPLANGSINKYLFILEDTTYINQDTVFTVSFRPRKGKNFKGMQGQLFINTNGFALQQVIAEPYETEGFKIKIQQQYEWVENRKWFPKQLNSFLEFPQMIINGIPIYGEGKSYIKGLKLDPPLKRSEFTPVTLMMAPRASEQPDSVWNKYRDQPLDVKESKTYHVLDSVGKAENLDRKMKMVNSVFSGQIPVGPISIDINRLFKFNNFEGWRLGAGVHTNDLLSEKFSVGGFYGYGFRDQRSKYGADILVHLKRKRNANIKALYENEVMELGGNQFIKPGMNFLTSNIYPFFVNRMDRREKTEFQINGRLLGNLSAYAFANRQVVRSYRDYAFTSYTDEGVKLFLEDYNLVETGVTLRYAPGEKLARTQTREIKLGGRFPVFYFKYTRGWNDILDGDIQYERFDVLVEKTFKIKLVGDFSVSAVAGYVPDNVPLSLLYNARGTNSLDYNRRWIGIASPGSFETMHTNEFMHSSFVAIHLRHNFKDLLLKTENFAPQFILVHNMLYGKMDNKENHNVNFSTANKGFMESGIQFDNLIRSNFTTLGLGVFYRYGEYSRADQIENFAFKLTSGWIL